jgi:CheY-like chemotaxis protein
VAQPIDTAQASILIVDDEYAFRQLVHATFDSFPEVVVEASNGMEALAIAHLHCPTVVILDLGMPGLDGIDVCRSLRADPTLGAPTVIVVSGSASLSAKDEALAAGADYYLAKPFSPTTLLGLVALGLERRS